MAIRNIRVIGDEILTKKAKEVKAKQDAELEQLKAALQTLGVETEEKEEIR